SSRQLFASSLSRGLLQQTCLMRPSAWPRRGRLPVVGWTGTCSSERWIATESPDGYRPDRPGRGSPYRLSPGSSPEACPTRALKLQFRAPARLPLVFGSLTEKGFRSDNKERWTMLQKDRDRMSLN